MTDIDPVLQQCPPHNDFPFYKGLPTRLTGYQWALLYLMLTLAFIVLTRRIPLVSAVALIPAILFPLLPLLTLATITPHWHSLFRRITWRNIKTIFLFALLNLCITGAIAILVSRYFEASANPAVAGLAAMDISDRAAFFIRTIPQLFGEELLAILPFLGLLTYFHSRRQLPRSTSLLIAWLVSSLIFGLAHLPTYNWNIVQCVLIIGCARLVLTVSYILTRNIWVSTATHIVSDWAIFTLTILATIPES